MKYIVAIDWGSSSASVAVGNRDEAGRLRILGVATRPMNEGVVGGEITNIEELTAATRLAIDELEQRLGIEISEAYASISGQELSCNEQRYYVPIAGGVVRSEDVDKLHELMNAIVAPNNNIHIFDRIPQTYLIGSSEQTRNPIGRFGNKLEANYKFVFGSGDNVGRLRLAFDTLGIKLLGIFTAPQASAAATLTPDERELGVAVIDLGAMTTEVAVWHDNIMRHLFVVPLGSAAINRDMRSAAIPAAWIEKLKIKYGYASPELIDEEFVGRGVKVPGTTSKYDKEVSFEMLSQIIEARLNDIVDAVSTELRESNYINRLGSGLVLTGGGANLKKIDELLRNKLRLDVRVAGVEPMSVSEGTNDEHLKAEFATVVGVLMLGLDRSNLEGSSYSTAPHTPKKAENTEENKTSDSFDTAEDRRKIEKTAEEAARQRKREAEEAERRRKKEEKEARRREKNARRNDDEESPKKESWTTRLFLKRDVKSEGDSFVE